MILRGIKKAGYRSRSTNIRGEVYIYAVQKMEDSKYYSKLGMEYGTLPVEVIIGIVEIVDCKYRFLYGDYEWKLANPKRLQHPIKPEHQPQPVFFKPFKR
jgi:hypothetical protein